MAIHVKLLHCALALADHKNFRRAAQASHISQPSLSRYIQDIERQVGTRLFEREVGGVTPTDAGKVFLEHAREVVARSADLEREMDLLRGLEKGELRIGAGTYPSAMIVDRAVAKILLPLLMKRELDIAVIVVDGIAEEPSVAPASASRSTPRKTCG